MMGEGSQTAWLFNHGKMRAKPNRLTLPFDANNAEEWRTVVMRQRFKLSTAQSKGNGLARRQMQNTNYKIQNSR